MRGGAVIGATDDVGAAVADRPVSPKDLYQTIYRALGIDADYENYSLTGRPIKLVDEGSLSTSCSSDTSRPRFGLVSFCGDTPVSWRAPRRVGVLAVRCARRVFVRHSPPFLPSPSACCCSSGSSLTRSVVERRPKRIRLWKAPHDAGGQRSYIPGVGRVRITGVNAVELDELTDADAKPDGFATAEDLRRELREIYGEKIASGHQAFRIEFCRELEAPADSHIAASDGS